MIQFILISIVFLVYEFGILLNPKKIINLKKKLDEVRNLENIDFVLYGVTNAYGITDYPEINNLTNNV